MFTKLFQTLGAVVPSSHLVFQRPISVTSKPHIMKIRKHKMRKSKWRKRINKEWFQYKKKHVVKKQKSEGFFRARMHEMLTELEQFNAMGYVKETMAKANKEWHLDAAPSGRKRHPHWSTLMSLEELFGVENSDYIDKRCGLPSLEDRPALDKLREEYRRAYIVPDPVELLEKFNNAARISEGTRERTAAEEIGGGLSSSDAKKKK